MRVRHLLLQAQYVVYTRDKLGSSSLFVPGCSLYLDEDTTLHHHSFSLQVQVLPLLLLSNDFIVQCTVSLSVVDNERKERENSLFKCEHTNIIYSCAMHTPVFSCSVRM